MNILWEDRICLMYHVLLVKNGGGWGGVGGVGNPCILQCPKAISIR